MAEDSMDVEQETSEKETNSENNEEIGDADFILEHLVNCKDVFYKSQQLGENDLNSEEKKKIAGNIFLKSKANFLSRFGKHLTEEQLNYFQKYTNDSIEGYDVKFYLNNFRTSILKKSKDIKNRRYSALTKLIDENSYFSETEMMRRNPLLYDQLVGQYLSEDERKQRDNLDTKNITFVNLLLESIDRDWLKKKQKQQQEDEDNAMEEEEEEENSSNEDEILEDHSENDWVEEEQPSTSRWGEFSDDSQDKPNTISHFSSFSKLSTKIHNFSSPSKDMLMITATERRLLKDEFISIMYQNFLDGKDTDFDYTSVDNNEDYDNLNIKSHDAEDRYFDSESPENITPEEDTKMATENNTDTSEDELDVFMNRLNQQQAIKQLARDISNL